MEELSLKLEYAKKATQTCLNDEKSLVDFHRLSF